MRSTLSALLGCSLLFASGCDCSGPVSCSSDEECGAGEVCLDGTCTPPSDSGAQGDAGPGVDPRDAGPTRCTADDQCAGGVCVEGACCPSAGAVCGSSCCRGAAEVCFANACVVPGATCRTAEDCADGEYCEPGLGDGPSMPDGGMPSDGGTASCLGAAPSSGRCVALPPRCEGEPAPGEECLRECEYRPDPDGPLNAVEQWRWGPDTAVANPGRTDVWSTPTVGRVTDTNCDGAVDELDPPNIVFVSGATNGTCCGCGGTTTCKTGALRALDGQSGREVWTSRFPAAGSLGWSGVSVALGDVDHDGDMEIAAVTGEGHVALVDHTGATIAVSDMPIVANWLGNPTTGWGGGLSIADMDHDGDPEIAYGRVVFTTDGASIRRLWEGGGDWGRAVTQAVCVFVNLDADPELELLAGRTAYEPDGTIKWNRAGGAGQPPAIPAGFSAVANFDADPEPEVVHVGQGRVYLLEAASGADELTSLPAMGASPGSGGPPTIADFDGDGEPEFGVAWREYYQVFEADYASGAITSLWATPNHDLSSSVTGSTVFDFEGDGAAEVIYNDECFLWVYDGRTGGVRYATLTTSFTATEASLVADVDGDGSAEIVMVSNSASATAWHCNELPWTRAATESEPDYGRPAWIGSDGAGASYRGIRVLRAADDSWVGTRTLWNQHAYSVSNVCGDRGDACTPPSGYGDIPMSQVANWGVGFLNNFRQNIQGEGIFDAPDATVTLDAECTTPVHLVASVRNLGARLLPAGVEVGFYVVEAGAERELGRGATTTALFPGQVAPVELDAPADLPPMGSIFRARILVDPAAPTFRECRDDNNQSPDTEARRLM